MSDDIFSEEIGPQTIPLLMPPSDEQARIINATIGPGPHPNITCDAVAGAGKTTTVLWIAKLNPEKSIVQVTYNRHLAKESAEKAAAQCIDNLYIRTYHSLASRCYSMSKDDDGLEKILLENTPLRRYDAAYVLPDILIIDEAQDMTEILYTFIWKFIHDVTYVKQSNTGNIFGDDLESTRENEYRCRDLQIIVLGDNAQSMYEFRGADRRYLTMSPQIFLQSGASITAKPPLITNMVTSYRITRQIANFVNHCCLTGWDNQPTQKHIIATRDGPMPQYFYCNPWSEPVRAIFPQIITMIAHGEITPSDIFVLLSSMHKPRHYVQLANQFTEYGIPCFVSSRDERELVDGEIAGKVVFTTRHQAKGRERKVVILYDFNVTYVEEKKGESLDICSNVLYVGMTRAITHLFMIHDMSRPMLPFLRHRHLRTYAVVHGTPKIGAYAPTRCKEYRRGVDNNGEPANEHLISVTEITRFLSREFINTVGPQIAELFVPCDNYSANSRLPADADACNYVQNGDLIENVSDINGIVIPAIYSYMRHKHSFLDDQKINNTRVGKLGEIMTAHKHALRNLIIGKKKDKNTGQRRVLYHDIYHAYTRLACIYWTQSSGLFYRICQLPRFDWLSREYVQHCFTALNTALAGEHDIQYEVPICATVVCRNERSDRLYDSITIGVSGRIDAISTAETITETTLWEFKCTAELTLEHKLQTVLYAYIMYQMGQKSKLQTPTKYRLLNIRTGECFNMIPAWNHIEAITCATVVNYCEKDKIVSDEEFLHRCAKVTVK